MECRRHASSTSTEDYYVVLGLKPTATQSEVKNAFYSLSKQFHPDRNPEVSQEFFQNIVNAYEILGNRTKREVYDLSRRPVSRRSPVPGFNPYSRPQTRRKQFEDLDLTFEDFQEFQHKVRNRSTTADDVPNQFFREWGSKKFKARKGEDVFSTYSTYRDSYAAERERREQDLWQEQEKERAERERHVPEFEKQLKDVEHKLKSQASKRVVVYASASLVLILLASVFLLR